MHTVLITHLNRINNEENNKLFIHRITFKIPYRNDDFHSQLEIFMCLGSRRGIRCFYWLLGSHENRFNILDHQLQT